MSQSLQERLDRLEAQRAALFARLEGLSDERLNQRPGEGQWSVIQVLCHLTSAEEASLADVRKRIGEPEKLQKSGIVGALKSAVLTFALRSGLRFKAPARAAEVPDEQSLKTTRQRWDAVRADWRSTIGSLPPELADKALFRHPRVGKISVAQALTFMRDHVEHHESQIDRILAAAA